MKNAKEKMNEKDVQKLFYKTNPMEGISLIVLVITIIIIIILATAVIVSIVGNNPIAEARKAVDDSNIRNYTEQIELIRGKIILKNEDYIAPTIYEMEEELKKEKWVVSTEIIMDEGIEKLKIVTKEGYIFYITETETEYKGKGKVVDTSALKRDDVIQLIPEETTTNGQYVKIISKAEDYYILKYKIGENTWTEIKSGERVEVGYEETIYAKLFYGLNEGVEFKLKISETNPSIIAKNIDTSNVKRKTDNLFANLFDITWGNSGTGTIEYEVTGNLLFRNQNYSNKSIENVKDLELGSYIVKCIITSPSGKYTASAQKQVSITTLANTVVSKETQTNIFANAIYSMYDLAYFRDLVNNGNSNINAKQMEDIDLNAGKWSLNSENNITFDTNAIKWETIGMTNYDITSNSYYDKKPFCGIYDGDYKKISGLYIDDNTKHCIRIIWIY